MKLDKFQKMLLEDLKKLGTGTTAIAISLRRRGIKGGIEDSNSCPLARYLTQEYGADVEVTDDDITVGGVTLSPPTCVRKFVAKFDNGDYPDLIKEESK